MSPRLYIRYLQGICSGAIHTEPSELDERLLKARVLEREAKARLAQYRADLLERALHSPQDKELQSVILKIPRRLSARFHDPEMRADVEREANALIVKMLSGGDEL